MEYPYSDELLTYNEFTKHYTLTENALIASGIDLRARLSRRRGTPVSEVINRFVNRVTEVVYNYIHKHNIANKRQDEMIAHSNSFRAIIYRALIQQAEYMLMNGDLTRSIDRDKRELAIDYSTIETLNTVVPEFGISILYSGYIGG